MSCSSCTTSGTSQLHSANHSLLGIEQLQILKAQLTYFDGLLTKLANDISRQESSVRYEERNINAYKQLLSQNWDGLAEWMKLNEQYNAIQTRISADLAQKDKQREAELINEAKSAKK